MDTKGLLNIADSGWPKQTGSYSKAATGSMMESVYFNRFSTVTGISRIACDGPTILPKMFWMQWWTRCYGRKTGQTPKP